MNRLPPAIVALCAAVLVAGIHGTYANKDGGSSVDANHLGAMRPANVAGVWAKLGYGYNLRFTP